jgi:hypothetical protein
MTEQELKKWILRRLGSPIAKVCLDELHLEDAVDDAKRWFAAKKGVDRDITLDLFSGKVEYVMPEDCDAVLDVSFQVSPLDISLIFAPHIIADEKVPYNAFAAPSSAGLYSSLVQSLQYVDMAKRIINSETCNTIEQLPERDHDLLKRYALAYAKMDLGNIYSKYSSWPTAQGQVQLNGPALISQAEAAFEKLEEEIYNSAMPMPFFAQ